MAAVDADLPAAEDVLVDDTLAGDLGDTLSGAELADAAAEEAAQLAAEEAAAVQEAAAAQEASTSMDAATLKLPSNGTLKLTSNATRKAQAAAASRANLAASRSDWMSFGESVKPSHLRVPTGVYDIVDRLIQPVRQDPSDVVLPPPRHGTGLLEPKANVDSVIVRSFIHRLDRNHDDLIEPKELAELSVKRKLGIKDDQIMSMFERIIEARPPGKRHNVGISALEICNEMKVDKSWMKTTDISVTCEDGETYHVAAEQETLERWCRTVQLEFAPDYPELGAPASWSATEIESFFASLLSAQNPQTGKLLQSEAKVQALLKCQSDIVSRLSVQPRVFASAVVAGQRSDWGWEAQPYRSLWLRFFKAIGLQPLQAIDNVHGKLAARADDEAKIKPIITPNVANAKKKPLGGKVGVVRVRDAKPKVEIREGQAEAEHLAKQIQRDAEAASLWDEKRSHTQSLVNSTITKGISSRPPSTGADGGYPGGAAATDAGVGISFDARRRYLQMQAKQGRDSEQQKSIGKDRQELAKQASLLGQAGMSVANLGVKFRGPHQHLGFSHHHNTNSVEPSRLKYDKELCYDIGWDGSYVDHSKLPPVMADVKLSKMDPRERDRQFGTYFPNPDNQSIRVAGLDGVKDVMDKYNPWKNPEFREDAPNRHGKYGRRCFDQQVSEPPILHKISGIDSKPMEDFFHQQDLVDDFLNRTLPPGQKKHFDQYYPTAEMPYRKEVDMAGRHLTGMGNYI